MNEKSIIHALQQGDTTALQAVYQEYRQSFLYWARGKFAQLDQTIIEDAYSDLVLDFYENLQNGKYSHQAAIKTYLFTMGRNKLINITKKQALHYVKQNEIIAEVEQQTIINPIRKQQENENSDILQSVMKEMCEDCRSVLMLFYFHNLSMEKIAEKMDYKNANVAKSKKNVCYQKLKKLMQAAYEKVDFF